MKSAAEQRRADAASIIGIPLTMAVVIGAQWLEGGRLQTLAQPTAALVVFGGTAAALLVSYPLGTLRRAAIAVVDGFRQPPPPTHALVMQFTQYAVRAKRKGMMSLESEISATKNPFLIRALTLVIDGFDARDVRNTLVADSRQRDDADEANAAVLEAAAGYSPTLGILGAVLGLIHVMENLSVPAKLGSGIAVAFVATVYGVGAANLLFLPLATKLRAGARATRLTRELIIEGIAAVQSGMHPRLMEQHLATYVRATESRPQAA